MSAFIGPATDGGTPAGLLGGIRCGASRDVDSRRLSVRTFPPTSGVPGVAFKLSYSQPEGQVGNDAVWRNGLLAGDANVLLRLQQNGPDA